jgi:hypothetical protein
VPPIERWELPGGLSLATGGGSIDAEWWPENPRGLLAVGFPAGPDGRQILLNYIAVEPVVGGVRGYSELEDLPWELLDDRSRADGIDLSFVVTGFQNGATIEVRARVLPEEPGELVLTAGSARGAPEPDLCIVSATMGNMARLRTLELGRRVVHVSELRDRFDSWGFTPGRLFPLPDPPLARARPGDDEPLPVFGWPDGWDYRGEQRLVQYWRLEERPPGPAFVRVNARRTYWATQREIPGGPSIENFELQIPYRAGVPMMFGVLGDAHF